MTKLINILNHIDYHPALKVSVENGIKFANLKHLNIKNWRSRYNKELEDFTSCSFPSNLESLSFTHFCIHLDFKIMSAFKKLQIKYEKITFIDCHQINNDSLIYIIDLFSKSNSVCFDQWRFTYYEYDRIERLDLAKIEIKNLLFTNCWFNTIERLKETITQIGLDKKIEKITFDDNCTDIDRRFMPK